MNLLLIMATGAITYISRSLALVFAPTAPQSLQVILNRVPAPLFAGLAAISLLNPDGGVVSLPIVAAVGAGLLTVRFRSLPITLVSGLAGYGMAIWIRNLL